MYHCFLIHLSADGHLGYFHVLAIVNSAVMNICPSFFYATFFFWHLENIKVEVDLEG